MGWIPGVEGTEDETRTPKVRMKTGDSRGLRLGKEGKGATAWKVFFICLTQR